MLFSVKKFIDGDCRVTCGVVMVQHPSACNSWSHTCHPFPESYKDFPVKCLIDSLSWWHKFLVDDPLTVKKQMSINLILDLLILAFVGRGEFAVCHSRLWRFVSGSYSKNPLFISCDNATEEFWLPLKALQKINTHIPPIGLLLSREVLWNRLGAQFSHVQILS